MADARKTSEKGGISPVMIIGLAAGGILIAWGVSQMGGPKGTNIRSTLNFNHIGIGGPIKLRVRFGKINPLGFLANPDMDKTVGYELENHDVWTPIETTVDVLVPPKTVMQFPLPFTYDAEALILDEFDNVFPDGVVRTENVFTHTEDFEVIML